MLTLPSSKLKTLFSPLALALSLVIATPVLANPEHGRGQDKNQLRHVLAQLDLSQEQRQDVKQILKQSRADTGLIAEDIKNAKTELFSLIHADSWNETAVETAIQQNQQTKATLALEKASGMHQIWLLLTDKQQAKLAKIADRKQEKAGAKGNKKSKGDKSERSREGQFARLDLSDEQKTTIKAIKEQNYSQQQQAKETQKAFRNAERTLIASTEFNDTAYLALQAEYQAAHLQQAMLMAKTHHDIWNVLSAEQKAKVLAKMEERKARS